MSSESSEIKKKKRPICSRCHRPSERTCICKALPDTRISLKKCQLVILQHPHEVKRKNRSLPLVELCIEDEHFHAPVSRRFGDQLDPSIMQLLQKKNVMLVYPTKNAVSLTQGLQQIRKRQNNSDNEEEDRITVILLDSTWKQSREMHNANIRRNKYPETLINVALTSEDFTGDFRPARFDIRTPPSPEHLSTAECIAFIVAKLEGEPSHYDTIMKPLDLMVEQWNSFSNRGAFSFTNGDGNMDTAKQINKAEVAKGSKRKLEGDGEE